jgi:ABC-2 type transport system ATP-binding protein
MITSAEEQSAAITVEHVVKRFGGFTAVNDISFSVTPAETFGLLGPNGAGKSSLIRVITTVLRLTSGRITVCGEDVSHSPDRARLAIGVVPQALTSDTELTVEENLDIYAKLYGVNRSTRRTAISGLLEMVGLEDRKGATVGTL